MTRICVVKNDFMVCVCRNVFKCEDVLTAVSEGDLTDCLNDTKLEAFLTILKDNYDYRLRSLLYDDLCDLCQQEPQWLSTLAVSLLDHFRGAARAAIAAELKKIDIGWGVKNE